MRALREPAASCRSSCGRRARSSTRRPAWTRGSTRYHAVRGLVRERDVRVPDRQRRRRARRTQPAASRDQSRHGCAARSRGAVPHDQAHARVLPVLRRAGLARGLSVAGRARRRQVGRPAAVRRRTRGSCARRFARHVPELALGGWANPHADATNAGRTISPTTHFTAEFFLTQVVSHHDVAAVERFHRGARTPARSSCPASSACSTTAARTRRRSTTLKQFLPVPVEGLTHEFADGATPDEVCARTIRALARRPASNTSTCRTCRSGARARADAGRRSSEDAGRRRLVMT